MMPAPAFTTDQARWQAVTARDPAADGLFVYAVRTTGVFCLPSCPSRPALRKNVEFFKTADDARAAGYRPCKRCGQAAKAAGTARGDAIAKACRMIETAETPPKLDDLARVAGLSPHYFHRVFKQLTGVTPKAYATAHRATKMRRALSNAQPVTTALYDAGYNAASRFYAEAQSTLGMPPASYGKGGAGATIHFAVGDTSLGAVLVAATGKGVCAIELGEDPSALVETLQSRFQKASFIGADTAFEELVARILAQVEHPSARFDLPLDIQGTAFQTRVWEALRRIPLGKTASYAEIAAAIGSPTAARAVAGACAANPVALAVPCHRVVRTGGDLSGYRWGVDRKQALLRREADAAE
jgi:AraC family transcriptional regulator of adaptative response/methylated-DNA-[protein]-cysteine methyltransferase